MGSARSPSTSRSVEIAGVSIVPIAKPWRGLGETTKNAVASRPVGSTGLSEIARASSLDRSAAYRPQTRPGRSFADRFDLRLAKTRKRRNL
jgi:hypothetical protein